MVKQQIDRFVGWRRRSFSQHQIISRAADYYVDFFWPLLYSHLNIIRRRLRPRCYYIHFCAARQVCQFLGFIRSFTQIFVLGGEKVRSCENVSEFFFLGASKYYKKQAICFFFLLPSRQILCLNFIPF